MYEDLSKEQIIIELKNLIEKVEKLEDDTDAYCNYMKCVILNTYSEN